MFSFSGILTNTLNQHVLLEQRVVCLCGTALLNKLVILVWGLILGQCSHEGVQTERLHCTVHFFYKGFLRLIVCKLDQNSMFLFARSQLDWNLFISVSVISNYSEKLQIAKTFTSVLTSLIWPYCQHCCPERWCKSLWWVEFVLNMEE